MVREKVIVIYLYNWAGIYLQPRHDLEKSFGGGSYRNAGGLAV